jgi:hypothetical protein
MFYLELITKLIYVSNIQKMYDIIKYGYNKDFKNYFKLIYNMTNEEFNTMNLNIINPNYSILNSSVFVIHDFERFIKSFKSSDLIINQGPQKYKYNLERKHFSFNNIHGNIGNIR